MKVTIYGVEYECDSALRGDDYVLLFTEGSPTIAFFNVSDFEDFILDGGEWSYPYVTLKPDSWVGDSAPFTQEVDYAGVTPSNNVLISVRTEGITDEKLEHYSNAMIEPTYQGDGFIRFSAFGYKPTVNLEFNVKTLF